MDNLDIKLNLDFLWELTCEERSYLETKLNTCIEESRNEIAIERVKEKWTCRVCNKSTFDVEYDYLISPTLHLGCSLVITSDKKLKLEADRNREVFCYD